MKDMLILAGFIIVMVVIPIGAVAGLVTWILRSLHVD